MVLKELMILLKNVTLDQLLFSLFLTQYCICSDVLNIKLKRIAGGRSFLTAAFRDFFIILSEELLILSIHFIYHNIRR